MSIFIEANVDLEQCAVILWIQESFEMWDENHKFKALDTRFVDLL